MKSPEELTRQLDDIKLSLMSRDLGREALTEIESELNRLEDLVSASPRRRRSLRELKGLGKDLWRSVDVDKYIREERRSWG